jgi:hypothetical protein
MAARKLTAAQQRDRRAKMMLAVLGVVLLGVVGFEIPSFLGGSGTPAAAPPATTTTAGASAVLADATAPAAAQQLANFSRFAAKNPFHALAGTTTTGQTQTAPAKTAQPPKQTTTAGRIPTPAPLVLTLHPVATTTSESSKPAGPLVTAAVLRLNGARHVITVGQSFPDKHPIFKLLAVGSSTMWVRLLGGSLTNGSQTLVVHADRPVQLLNRTADLRYLLRFLRVTVAPPPAPTTTALTSTVAQASP